MPIHVEHLPQESCEGCPFGGPKVGSKGDPKSNWVIVGESPGANEVRTLTPFSGPSGKILHTYAPEERVYILNAMECSPHKRAKDQTTLAYAARTCRDRLINKIQAHPRRLIVAMGNPAVWSLTGDYSLKITQIRGQLIPSPLAELGILPMVHPAALMRGTGSFRQFREDLAYAAELADGKPPRIYTPPQFKSFIGSPDWRSWWLDPVWQDAYRFLEGLTEATCDIETSGFDFFNDRILSVGITDDTTNGDVVYCFGPEHLWFLKKYLESRAINWNWHNGTFDVKFLRTAGVYAHVDDDTMLMSYTLDERPGVHDLETVAQDVLDAPDYKHMIKPYLPNKKASYELIPQPVLHDYMSKDVGNTSKIRNVYREMVRSDPACEKLYTKTLIPASELIARVETNGLHVDQEWLDDVDGILTEALAKSTNKIQEIVGRAVNPDSPAQMSEVLFKQFRLPNKFKGSTDKNTLKWLAEKPTTRHPIVLALRDHRIIAKQYGTYVKGLRKWIRSDGRVYSSYKLHGTVTGRLASADPNLQNIPRDPVIRGIFHAAPGCVLLEVDLSQAELRSLAALSGDPGMIELYAKGGDIHTELAIFLFGKDFTHEQRVKCKNVNFGIVYGITQYGLQDQIGGSLESCRKMIEGWGKRFPVAWAFIERCRATPLNQQTIVTIFGRKKRVGLVTRGNLQFLQNEAANFPHQSTASDITLHAAMRTEPKLRAMGIKIVNLIHDSIVMEVPQEATLIAEAKHLVTTELAQVPIDWGITTVPFKADAELTHRWGKWDKRLLASEEQPLLQAA